MPIPHAPPKGVRVSLPLRVGASARRVRGAHAGYGAGACSGVRNRRVCASANDEGTFQVRAARERASARRTRGAST